MRAGPLLSALQVFRRILLGLIPLLVLVAVSELGLWALGLGEAGHHASLSRGFDATATYLLPAPDVPGGWKTHVFNSLESELTIPPKGDATRVLLFGGSNTQLLPETVLEQDLHGIDPSRNWEVLNLGRAGYGSERVLIYLSQAMQLEPDVVVIYSGHNEFVEAGFADELGFGTGGSNISWTQRAASALRGLRSFNTLAQMLGSGAADSSVADSAWADAGDLPDGKPMQPEPWVLAERTSFALGEEETQRYYDAFGKNLVAMCAAASRSGAAVVLCTPIGNLLVPPTRVSLRRWMEHQDLTRAQQRTLSDTINAANAGIPERFVELVIPTSNLRVFNWYSARMDGVHDAPFDAPTLRPLGAPLAEAPALPGDRKLASIEGAHWPDPAQWGAQVRARMAAISVLMQRDLTPDERVRLTTCAQGYREALALSRNLPQLLYSLGTVLWLLGEDDAEAVRLLQAARDRDVSPRAANTPIHEAIRRVAAQHGHVELLDSARIYAAANPNGLTGYEVMMDICHLQPGARVALMHMLAVAIPPLLDN